MLSELLSNIDESELIRKKKTEYKIKGINLRANRKYVRTILTINGPLEISRYVLRPKTKSDADLLLKKEKIKTVVPLDNYLRLSSLPFSMTPEIMLDAAFWAQSQSSYQEAEEAIYRARKLKINDDTIRQVTHYIGKIVFQEDCKRADDAYNKLNSGKLIFPDSKKKGVLYIEADGATVNTRSKDESGSSWKENKLGIVFSSDNIYTWTNNKGEKQSQINKREYTTFIGGVSEFKKHLLYCALKNGYGHYEKTIFLGDGATWLRNMCEEVFPDAQQILDFYHLCENVNTYAKHIFGIEVSLYSDWANKMCALLRESLWNEVLDDLSKRKNPANCPIDLLGYITNNIANIDYKRYIKEGFYIGSGAIESGNKSVLQHRLKQAGMRWNVVTAQSILTLRSKYKSGLWVQDVQNPIMGFLS